MLTSNTKSLENHVVSPEEEEKRLHWEGFAEKRFYNRNDIDRQTEHLHGQSLTYRT